MLNKYTILILLLVCFSACKFNTSEQLIVKEIEPLNMVLIADETGDYPPYFKICNQGKNSVSLKGVTLLKNLSTKNIFVFPDKQLQTNSCVVVFLSGKNHDYFKLNWENLIPEQGFGPMSFNHVFNKQEQLRQLIIAIEVPMHKLVQLEGRFKINDVEVNVKPKMLPLNGNKVLIKLIIEGKYLTKIIGEGKVKFELDTKLNEQIPVYILAGYINKQTDNVIPTWLDTSNYNLHTNFIVKPGKDALNLSNMWGNIITQFYVPEVKKSKAYAAIENLPKPTITNAENIKQYYIITNNSWLYDENKGLLKKGTSALRTPPYYGANYWKETKLPGFLYQQGEVDTKLISLKVHGNYSRMFEQKSLSFKALDESSKVTKVFRNAGQDNFGAHMRNALAFKLAGFDNFSSGVLLNAGGNNLGCYHLQPKINEHYLQVKYSVPSAEINLLESGQAYPVSGESTEFLSLMKQLEDGKISPGELKTHFNVKSVIEHFIINIFIGNTDWPQNNIRFWNRPENGVKWTYELFDCDISFALQSDFGPEMNNLKAVVQATDNYHSLIFKTLLLDDDFKERFINRFNEMLEGELSYAQTSAKLKKLKTEMEPCMREHFKAWPNEMYNYKIWESEVAEVDEYLKVRPSYVKQHLLSIYTTPLIP